MRQMGQWAARGLVGLLGLVASSTYAGSAPGGVVGYAPGSVAVPTLSEWTLIGLGLLLAVLAYRVLRARGHGRLLANLLVMGGAAAVGVGGHSLVGNANAVAYQVDMTSATGGALQVTWTNVTYTVSNATAVTQTITSISAVGGAFESDPMTTPRCTVGLQVSASSVCYVRFTYIPPVPL